MPGMDQAGKTGTTQNRRDVYFVGYTPYFTAGVWVGHDSIRDLVTNQRADVGIWRHVMERIHAELEPRRFERPGNFVTHTVCGVSGMLATSACHADPRGSQARSELFVAGTVPVTHCHIHEWVDVEWQTGLLPSPWTPADQLVSRSFITRDRSFMEVTGAVNIRAAWVEAPTRVSTLFDPRYDTTIWDYREYGGSQEIPVEDDIDMAAYGYDPDYVPAYAPTTTIPPVTMPQTEPPETIPPTEPETMPPTLPFTVPTIDLPPITWPGGN